MMTYILMAALVSAGIGALVYFLIKKKQNVAPAPTSNDWQVRYSTGMPASFVDRFRFPQFPAGSVHYCVKSAPAGRSQITFRFVVEGSALLHPTEGDSPAMVRLFLQRKGDNLSGQGEYEHYRWWSSPVQLATGGAYHFGDPLTPEYWTSVYGKHDPASFAAALADLDVVGFTFGGDFAGHGVFADGPVDFIVLDYQVT